MYRTQYSQKFYSREINARKNNLFSEEKESFTEIKINKKMQTTKDSFKLFINLKNLKNPFKKKDILTPRNQDIIPNLTKIEIIKQNKVPSMKENRKDIYKLIKKEKLKQKNKIDNYYNSMLIKESQLFRNNLYITQSEHKLFRSNSIINMDNNINNKKSVFSQNKTQYKNKNRINDIDIKNKIKHKNNEITSSTSVEFYKNNLDKKSSYNDNNNIITNYTRTTFLFPHKKKSKYEPNLFYKTSYKTTKSNLIRSYSCSDFSRIRSEISEVICKELKTKNDYCTLGRQMMKFNVIFGAQKNILKKTMNKERYNYDKNYAKLINLKTKIENSYKSYLDNMNKYLAFLHGKIKENILELNKYDKQIQEIDDDLEIIIVNIVKSQEYLQYLIERRNFLLLIKQKYANPESYYDELFIRDSKILLVGDAICNLKVTKLIKNKSVGNFNNNYLEVQEKIKEKGLNINNIKNYSKENIDENQLFQSVEEFIQLYKNSENKNLEYLRNEEIVGKQLIKMKQLYEDEKIMNENNYLNEIEEKEIELEKLINKNTLLKRTYEHYEKIIIKYSNNSNRNINYKKKERKIKISSIEMNALKKYREQFEKYKYDGFLLLNKLIGLLKNLSHIKYDKSEMISDIFNDHNIKEILKINLSKFNKEKLSLIYSYIILLISKYEIICKYIINKNDIYLLNNKNKNFIKDKAMELILIKKKKNSEDLKRIIKDKKIDDIKKIIDKSNKISAYIPNKVCPENNVKRYKAMKDIEKKIMIDNKHNFLQYEFNSLVHFQDSI